MLGEWAWENCTVSSRVGKSVIPLFPVVHSGLTGDITCGAELPSVSVPLDTASYWIGKQHATQNGGISMVFIHQCLF